MDFIHSANMASRAAQNLIDSKAYLVDLDLRPDDFFKWKSGIRAPVYCNCRLLNSSPSASRDISLMLSEVIQGSFPDVEGIVGLACAGIPWASRAAQNSGLPVGT